MLWHIGNTTVRTPYRLREALLALQGTALNGNLHGHDNENDFAKLLHTSGVVDAQRIEEEAGSDVSDLGRKWRSALSQLGFITHKLSDELLTNASSQIAELSGRAFEITPNGYRLIRSELTTSQQECYLRSLLAYRIPSVIEKRYDCNPFSPLKFSIDIILGLQDAGAEPFIGFVEFALFIQTASPDGGLDTVIQSIVDFRARKLAAQGNVRQFYKIEYTNVVKSNNPDVADDKVDTKAQTLDDYADLSFRYLKATGLFRNRGTGISLTPVKEELAKLIHATPEAALNDVEYLTNLWNGAQLPTDDAASALRVVQDLSRKIEAKGQSVTALQPGEDVSIKRHVLEGELLQLEETEYYRNQASQVDEISAWISALISGSATLPNGERIKVPKGEAPAYFEWVIWRAFLAINSLVNKPWEARRFQIDQDFLPVSCAPGSGPDMIFEFGDAIIVVEVTLTTNSRQEAAEGEPVRRHVARYAEAQGTTGKPVYGLFLAINIDSNTAHTFRTGDWYLRDDSKINLHIVPLTLGDFGKVFTHGKTRLPQMPGILKSLIERCRMQATQDAPVWKQTISGIVDQLVK